MKHHEFTINQSNHRLFGQCWIPDKKPLAVIALIHGLGEHSGRYNTHYSKHFTNHGIAVFSFDLPGHGRTPGKRGHIENKKTIGDCIDLLLEKCRQEFPNCPIVLYGHSLGGTFVLGYAINHPNSIQPIIATSPVIRTYEPVPPSKYFFAKVMNKVYPSLVLNNGLKREFLSQDTKVVKAYNEDPLVHPYVSARLGFIFLEEGEYILDNAAEIHNPVLLMVGENEKIVDGESIFQVSKMIKNVDFKLWPELYHELHNEPQKQEVLDFISAWIIQKVVH
jgi:acylglycerol lipase